MFLKVALSLLVFASLEEISIEGSECLPNLKNIAVYEGYENVLMNLTTDTDNVLWRVIPSSNESGSATIQENSGYRNPEFTGLFYPNQSGLVILHATTRPTPTTTPTDYPISTAGLYIAQCADNENRTGAKLVVVRAAPECSCNISPSEVVKLLCSIYYADVNKTSPIYATMTWKLVGVVDFPPDSPPNRTKIDDYVFKSTSTVTVPGNVAPIFTCTVTFNAPTDVEYDFIATNEPEFSASCSVEARRLENDSLVCVTTTTTTEPPTTEPSTTISTTGIVTTTTEPPTTEPPTTISTSPTTTPPTSASSTSSTTSTSTSPPPPTTPSTTSTTTGLSICALLDSLNIIFGTGCQRYCISKGFSGGNCVSCPCRPPANEQNCLCF